MTSYNLATADNSSVNVIDFDFPPPRWEVKLQDEHIWQRFHQETTEMIITKGGRRIFPHFKVSVSGLNPNKYYCVILQMEPAFRCKYKYSSSSNAGWVQSGSEEAQNPRRLYVHPEGPARGDFWMAATINFSKLKITNTAAPPPGQIVLSSMHKYQPYIIIAETSDPQKFTCVPHQYFRFEATQFIAVTAYQNPRITKMKIECNPFAKGFRKTGQAKCKRKWLERDEQSDEEEDDIDVVSVEENEQERSPSPPREPLPEGSRCKRSRTWRPWETSQSDPVQPPLVLAPSPPTLLPPPPPPFLYHLYHPDQYAPYPHPYPYFYAPAYPQQYPNPYLYSYPHSGQYQTLPSGV